MTILGILLIILAAPLLLTYGIQPTGKKNATWLRLGLIMGGVGILVVVIGSIR